MRKEILTYKQMKLLPLIKSFSNDFYLVDGAAIALYLGHRRSIDFDLFSRKKFENKKIRRKISRHTKYFRVLRDESGQFTLIINSVSFTFFEYPFAIKILEKLDGIIGLPDLITLAAMKGLALGQRPKWKDYVDLYFILQKYSLKKIINRADKIFSNEFNERIFREQLAYFDDIDYSEKIEYLPGFEVKDEQIKKSLVEASLEV